jgi:hypothetical protein
LKDELDHLRKGPSSGANKAAILASVRILQAAIVPISLTAKRGGMLQG